MERKSESGVGSLADWSEGLLQCVWFCTGAMFGRELASPLLLLTENMNVLKPWVHRGVHLVRNKKERCLSESI